MSQVYDVYVHATKGQWGVCSHQGQALMAHVLPDGTLRQERITPIRLGAEVAQKVRLGYRRQPRGKYLHRREDPSGRVMGCFSETHPELESLGGEDLVLFVTRPAGLAMEAALQEWESLLEKSTGTMAAGQKWLKRLEAAQVYLSAHAEHPAMVLMLAQWAIEHRQAVVATKPGMPEAKPQDDPLGWKNFLAGWFDEDKVQRTLEEMGWSLRDVVSRATVANNTDQDGEEWIAQASWSAF